MSINRRVDKLLSSHTQGQYTLKIKENELLIDAPTWINRTDRTLKEARHYSTLCVILLCAMARTGWSVVTELRIVVTFWGRYWFGKSMMELSGMMEKLSILIWVVVACTHTHKYVKIHWAVPLRLVYFTYKWNVSEVYINWKGTRVGFSRNGLILRDTLKGNSPYKQSKAEQSNSPCSSCWRNNFIIQHPLMVKELAN